MLRLSRKVAAKSVQIFIDGGNFHHLALRPCGLQELEFDFEAFTTFLAQGRIISEKGKRYYIGTVREQEGNQRSKEAMSRQTKLFNTLKKTGWEIKTSKLRERMEAIPVDHRVKEHQKLLANNISQITYRRFREKGIDVKIATDLVAAALDEKYSTAILVSSDTDLIQMIDWIRFRLKKQIEYVGFSISTPTEHVQPIMAFIGRTDSKQILKKWEIQRFRTERLHT